MDDGSKSLVRAIASSISSALYCNEYINDEQALSVALSVASRVIVRSGADAADCCGSIMSAIDDLRNGVMEGCHSVAIDGEVVEGKRHITVDNAVESYLKIGGYDGLMNPDVECACELSHIAPCGGVRGDCVAGYKVMGCTPECGMGCKWHIMSGRR